MSDRQIAILIDGGFFLKRLPKLVKPSRCRTAAAICACIRYMCRNHVKVLTGSDDANWHRYVYRIFFYDALPYDGVAHHPLENRQIQFGKSDVFLQRTELFDQLRRQRNVALRLGKVVREGDWAITGAASRKIIATKSWMESLDLSAMAATGTLTLTAEQQAQLTKLKAVWSDIENHAVKLQLRQKSVDMRIGLDITSITLKKQAQTIVLVSGDSDFVPAAKLARREGVQFILDPMWQAVNDDLFEHIDGLQSGLPKPTLADAAKEASAAAAAASARLVGTTEISEGNLRNHHFYLTPFMAQFPRDALGGANEEERAPRTVTIDWGGAEPVETDIDQTKRIFRRRGWIRTFFARNGAKAGDAVVVEERAPYSYRVTLRRAGGTI